MRWIINVVKALLLLLAVLAGVSFLLPEHRQVERSREIAAAPERIWPLIADPRRWAAWSPWFARDPAMKLDYSGAASGAGAQWRWDSATQGRGSMRFDAAQPPQRLAYTLVFEDMGSTATGALRLEPTGNTTRVVWTFDTHLGKNPVMRWFGLVMDRRVGADFESGLARLEQAAKAQ